MVVEYKLYSYRAETLEGIYKAVKADGWQIWGYNDYLDYYRPQNAMEYLMLRDVLRSQGMSDTEIENQYIPEGE